MEGTSKEIQSRICSTASPEPSASHRTQGIYICRPSQRSRTKRRRVLSATTRYRSHPRRYRGPNTRYRYGGSRELRSNGCLKKTNSLQGSQTARPAKVTRDFQKLIRTYTDEQIDLPWWFTPRLEWKRSRLAQQVRTSLKAIVKGSHAKRDLGTSRPRSILSMSLEGIDTLSSQLLDTTCDQLSTFLFAGHDTTSTTIAWMLYEVSRTPRALHAVRAELDELFGPDPSPTAVASRLLAPGGEELVNRMTYTSAVIKETLRLWPPGATSRMTRPGDGLKATVRSSEGEACELGLDGMMLYHVPYIIQRDPSIFGETANTFVPERWLRHDSAENIPAGAWRAFERGPRNCIGQELATIEARVVMALVARHFDFTKVGTGAAVLDSVTGQPEVDAHGQFVVAKKMYNVSLST